MKRLLILIFFLILLSFSFIYKAMKEPKAECNTETVLASIENMTKYEYIIHGETWWGPMGTMPYFIYGYLNCGPYDYYKQSISWGWHSWTVIEVIKDGDKIYVYKYSHDPYKDSSSKEVFNASEYQEYLNHPLQFVKQALSSWNITKTEWKDGYCIITAEKDSEDEYTYTKRTLTIKVRNSLPVEILYEKRTWGTSPNIYDADSWNKEKIKVFYRCFVLEEEPSVLSEEIYRKFKEIFSKKKEN